MKCMVVMDPGKTRAAVINLLDAFGVYAEVIELDVTDVPASFAIVDTSSRCVALARTIQERMPTCRCIFLTSNATSNEFYASQGQISFPIFVVMPVTVTLHATSLNSRGND
jgi:hypothetical protein